MKIRYSFTLLRATKVFFILVFCFNFLYQKGIDNEILCGALGAPEAHCPYSFLYTAKSTAKGEIDSKSHEDHVCISCPCNLQLSVSWNLNVAHVYLQLNYIYINLQDPRVDTLEEIEGFFRPPRLLNS